MDTLQAVELLTTNDFVGLDSMSLNNNKRLPIERLR